MLLKNQITKTSNLVLFIVLISVGAGSNLAFAEPLTIINATFVDSFSVATQESTPSGVAFSSDGTKMFVVGTSGDAVHEYTLGTAFDVSTASFVDSFSVKAQENASQGVAFSSDGTKMFVVGSAGDAVYEYTLGTAFDVSTGLFVDSFSVAEQDTSPLGLAFSSDGAKMFVVGSIGDAVYEYILTTGFDVSTASFVDSFSVAAQDDPTDVAFSSDGEKMFILGSGDAVYEYTLTTAFDVSAATFVDSFSVTAQEIVPHGLAFSSISAKMFVVGFVGRDVNEYNLTSIGPCSPPASGNWLVDSSCTMTGDATAAGNVIVPNGEVLTIPNGITLTVPSGSNITILSGGGILIEFGGTLIVVS